MSQADFKKTLRDIMHDAGLPATHRQADIVFRDLWPAIVRHTHVCGGRFVVRDFGTFRLEEKPARQGRNPRTGEKVKIPAKTVFKFKSRANI